jgi:RimJ/RimL family protein N-acetyltransferase
MERKTKLRPVEPRDIGNLWRWRYQNAEYFFGELGSYPDHCRFWERQLKDEYQENFIITTLSDTPIGSVSLSRIGDGGEYGRFQIAKAVQGYGFGKSALFDIMERAFVHWDMRLLIGVVFADNDKATGLSSGLGFRFGNLIRNRIEKNGVLRDVVIMEMRQFEFEHLYGEDIWQ